MVSGVLGGVGGAYGRLHDDLHVAAHCCMLLPLLTVSSSLSCLTMQLMGPGKSTPP